MIHQIAADVTLTFVDLDRRIRRQQWCLQVGDVGTTHGES